MKAKELIRKIEAVGWVFVRQTGSHKIFKKDGEAELITVPEHGSRDLKNLWF